MKINKYGFFESNTNEGYYHDEKLCKGIIDICKRFGVNSCYDLGCGNGSYVKALGENHIHAEGYDGNPNTLEMTQGNCQVLNLTREAFLSGQKQLVISLEVGEHINKIYEGVFFDNLVRHTWDLLIVSWAVPGQGGHGHVNERSNYYIRAQMMKRGMVFNHTLTQQLRDDVDFSWFKNSLMVFNKRNLDVVMPTIYRDSRYIVETVKSLVKKQKLELNVTFSVGNDDDRIYKIIDDVHEGLVKEGRYFEKDVINIDPGVWATVHNASQGVKFNANFANCMAATNFERDLLYVEDDVKFTSNWHEKMSESIGKLDEQYNERYVLTLYGPWKFYKRLFAEEIPPGHFYGTQAVYIKREFQEGLMHKVLEEGVRTFRHQADLLLDEYCRDNGIPIVCLTTSLVQHIGKNTTGLGNFHQTDNFRE